jgi:type IV secretory pathway VirB10-like protein
MENQATMEKISDMKQRQVFRAAARSLLFALIASLTAMSAQAQAPYIWLDDKGIKQLSDQPPPPSVPQNRILRQPRNGQVAPAPAAADDPSATATMTAAAPAADSQLPGADGKPKRPATLAERNADYARRQAEAAAAAQKAAQESTQKASEAANCDNARSNQLALESGIRMSAFDKNGQRSYLTEAQRAERSKQNQSVLAGCPR